uniref:SURP and G-patch domain-containing protein 1 n=2 Tax=Cacopsylla melanoneura TaxID=428564 RepID=A0A8D8TQA8_9HEMI
MSSNMKSKKRSGDRFDEMYKQQELIEKKKQEIQAKVEEKKRKETEEALMKLGHNMNSKPLLNTRKNMHSRFMSYKNIKVQEEPTKPVLPGNIFSNDGSFLQQFHKLAGIKAPKLRKSNNESEADANNSDKTKEYDIKPGSNSEDNGSTVNTEEKSDDETEKEPAGDLIGPLPESLVQFQQMTQVSVSMITVPSIVQTIIPIPSVIIHTSTSDPPPPTSIPHPPPLHPPSIPPPQPLHPQNIPPPSPLLPHAIPPPTPLQPYTIPPPSPLQPHAIPTPPGTPLLPNLSQPPPHMPMHLPPPPTMSIPPPSLPNTSVPPPPSLPNLSVAPPLPNYVHHVPPPTSLASSLPPPTHVPPPTISMVPPPTSSAPPPPNMSSLPPPLPPPISSAPLPPPMCIPPPTLTYVQAQQTKYTYPPPCLNIQDSQAHQQHTAVPNQMMENGASGEAALLNIVNSTPGLSFLQDPSNPRYQEFNKMISDVQSRSNERDRDGNNETSKRDRDSSSRYDEESSQLGYGHSNSDSYARRDNYGSKEDSSDYERRKSRDNYESKDNSRFERRNNYQGSLSNDNRDSYGQSTEKERDYGDSNKRNRDSYQPSRDRDSYGNLNERDRQSYQSSRDKDSYQSSRDGDSYQSSRGGDSYQSSRGGDSYGHSNERDRDTFERDRDGYQSSRDRDNYGQSRDYEPSRERERDDPGRNEGDRDRDSTYSGGESRREQEERSETRARKRKSRWGEGGGDSGNQSGSSISLTTPIIATPSGVPLPIPGVALPIALGKPVPLPQTTINVPGMHGPAISQVGRSDPALLAYARQAFGTTNLSEEDWKKAEDHYKINLLYQDMLRKRQELDRLRKKGQHKYEYDSDEETDGGTWEHKLRMQEMEATQIWANELTEKSRGRHHIGDFLPPDELERFMEKYNALKEGREPDLSDYKEFKLKEDNVGFQMLQKLGWTEGSGLGQDGGGIQEPVNKASSRLDNQGLGVERPADLSGEDNEFDAYRKRMMLAYRFRPNPLNNPRRPYY